MAPRWPSGARNVTQAVVPYVDNSKAVVPFAGDPEAKKTYDYMMQSRHPDGRPMSPAVVPFTERPSVRRIIDNSKALVEIIDNNKALVPTTPVLSQEKGQRMIEMSEAYRGSLRNAKALVKHAGSIDFDPMRVLSDTYTASKAVVPWVAEKAVDAVTSEQAWALSCGAGLMTGSLAAIGPAGALVGAAAGATCLGTVALKGKRGAEHVGNATVNYGLATATNFTRGLNEKLDEIKGGLLGLGERVVNQFAGIGNDIGSNVNEAIKAITAAVGSFFGSGGGGGAGGAAQAVEGAANATRLLLTLAGAYIVYRIVRGPSLTLK